MSKSHLIQHIVAFSARNKSDIPKIKDGLKMLGNIPGVINFRISDNKKLDNASSEMDVVMSCEFVSETALADFKKHKIYDECIQVVRPLRDHRIVLDF